jgi:metal-responsive CopG/Arc/MetJ family transcriptional regulator
MDDNMITVQTRMPPALLTAIDQTVGKIGGNRSQFVRMAVIERLAIMAPFSGIEYRADGPSLSPVNENEDPQ